MEDRVEPRAPTQAVPLEEVIQVIMEEHQEHQATAHTVMVEVEQVRVEMEKTVQQET